MKRFAPLVVLCVLNCTGEMVCRRPNGAPSPDDCVQSLDPGSAAGAAAAAAVVWGSGNGCQLSGCHPTLTCNRQSGLCERPACGEGRAPCPLGTVCDSTTLRCK